MAEGLRFRDRHDAGRRLAAELARFRSRGGGQGARDQDAREPGPLVLALPRGGVPVAFEVACALGAPLDVVLVRKLGAPGQEELALGAVVDGKDPQLVLNEDLVEAVAPPAGYIEEQEKRLLAEIERRRRLYRGSEPPPDPSGRTVIVVDDGIATGATMKAALRAIRRSGPQRLVLAVPVAPAEALDDLSKECDEIVCLSAPEPFHAVGAHYRDFGQTTDEDVVALLSAARQARAAGLSA